MQWPGIIPGLQGGSLDASLGIISLEPEREDILNMIPFSQARWASSRPPASGHHGRPAVPVRAGSRRDPGVALRDPDRSRDCQVHRQRQAGHRADCGLALASAIATDLAIDLAIVSNSPR